MKRLVLAWVAVYAANLPLALLFGWGFTRDAGRAGMVGGVLGLLAIGALACIARRRVGLALVIGGVPVALSQVWGVPQIYAGFIGLRVAAAAGLMSWRWPGDSEVGLAGASGGVVATVVTGSILMGAGLALGSLGLWVRSFDGPAAEDEL